MLVWFHAVFTWSSTCLIFSLFPLLLVPMAVVAGSRSTLPVPLVRRDWTLRCNPLTWHPALQATSWRRNVCILLSPVDFSPFCPNMIFIRCIHVVAGHSTLFIFITVWNSIMTTLWWLSLFSCLIVSDSLRPHEPRHTRLLCPSLSPGVWSNSCLLSQWYCPTISSSVTPCSSSPQSFPASLSFPMHCLSQQVGSSHQVAKVWELQLHQQSSQWVFRIDFL